jgi:hypothetical protein
VHFRKFIPQSLILLLLPELMIQENAPNCHFGVQIWINCGMCHRMMATLFAKGKRVLKSRPDERVHKKRPIFSQE